MRVRMSNLGDSWKSSHVTIVTQNDYRSRLKPANRRNWIKLGYIWIMGYIEVYASAAITGSYHLELQMSPTLHNAKLLYSRPSLLAPTRNISSVAAIPKGHIRRIVSQSHAAKNRRSAFNQFHLLSITWHCMRKIQKPCRLGLQEEKVSVPSQFIPHFGRRSHDYQSSQEVKETEWCLVYIDLLKWSNPTTQTL